MKKLKKIILSACFCLLIASAVSVKAQAASVDHSVSVSYTKQMDDGTDNMTALPAGTVKTGDDKSPTIYASMVIISAAVLLLILIVDREKRKKEEADF